jgi:hypothetical protein
MERVRARLAAGHTLLAERMGGTGVVTFAMENAAVPGPDRMDQIRAEAREQAALLWERMKAL